MSYHVEQIVVPYETEELPLVLEALERCEAHLTAAIVSKDTVFQNKVTDCRLLVVVGIAHVFTSSFVHFPLFVLQILANTVNGTTYTGICARTTGAPQNHWFGPAGDPR